MAASGHQLRSKVVSAVRRAAAGGSPPAISSPVVAIPSRRVHASVYDKNPDDQLRPGLVQDDVITAAGPASSWAPHPATGVFGPPGGHVPQDHSSGGPPVGSVLDQKAWFRPFEDVE